MPEEFNLDKSRPPQMRDNSPHVVRVLESMEKTKGASSASSRFNLYNAAMQVLEECSKDADDEKVVSPQLENEEAHLTLCARIAPYSERFIGDMFILLNRVFADNGMKIDFGISGLRRDDKGKYKIVFLNALKDHRLEKTLEILRERETLEKHLFCEAAAMNIARPKDDKAWKISASELSLLAMGIIEDLITAPWEEKKQRKSCSIPRPLTFEDAARLKKIIETSLRHSQLLTACDFEMPDGKPHLVMYVPHSTPEALASADEKLRQEKENIIFHVQSLCLSDGKLPPVKRKPLEMQAPFLEKTARLALSLLANNAWRKEGDLVIGEAILQDASEVFTHNLRHSIIKWLNQALVFDEYSLSVRTFVVPHPHDSTQNVTRLQISCETGDEKALAHLPFLIGRALLNEDKQPPKARSLTRICQEEISRTQKEAGRTH
jgi:hypothetical protein